MEEGLLDSDVIYNDLEIGSTPLEKEVHNLQEKVLSLEQHIQSLESDVAKLCSRIIELKKEKCVLAKNISELFKTAKGEIERKDQIISVLRKQVDSFNLERRQESNNGGTKKVRTESLVDRRHIDNYNVQRNWAGDSGTKREHREDTSLHSIHSLEHRNDSNYSGHISERKVIGGRDGTNREYRDQSIKDKSHNLEHRGENFDKNYNFDSNAERGWTGSSSGFKREHKSDLSVNTNYTFEYRDGTKSFMSERKYEIKRKQRDDSPSYNDLKRLKQELEHQIGSERSSSPRRGDSRSRERSRCSPSKDKRDRHRSPPRHHSKGASSHKGSNKDNKEYNERIIREKCDNEKRKAAREESRTNKYVEKKENRKKTPESSADKTEKEVAKSKETITNKQQETLKETETCCIKFEERPDLEEESKRILITEVEQNHRNEETRLDDEKQERKNVEKPPISKHKVIENLAQDTDREIKNRLETNVVSVKKENTQSSYNENLKEEIKKELFGQVEAKQKNRKTNYYNEKNVNQQKSSEALPLHNNNSNLCKSEGRPKVKDTHVESTKKDVTKKVEERDPNKSESQVDRVPELNTGTKELTCENNSNACKSEERPKVKDNNVESANKSECKKGTKSTYKYESEKEEAKEASQPRDEARKAKARQIESEHNEEKETKMLEHKTSKHKSIEGEDKPQLKKQDKNAESQKTNKKIKETKLENKIETNNTNDQMVVSDMSLTHDGEIPVLHIPDNKSSEIDVSSAPKEVDLKMLEEDLNLSFEAKAVKDVVSFTVTTNEDSKMLKDGLTVTNMAESDGKRVAGKEENDAFGLNIPRKRKRRKVIVTLSD